MPIIFKLLSRSAAALPFVFALLLLLERSAFAHCDTMDGPVVKDAEHALKANDIKRVLKWVGKEDEAEVQKAFAKASTVRLKGAESQELADLYFFETVVRLHRAREGAPYTGLRPAGSPLEPGVAAADSALAGGNVEQLVQHTVERVSSGVRGRFAQTVEAKRHAAESIEAGRLYVKHYVDFVHYVERLFVDSGVAHAAPVEAAEHSAHSH